ncbi:MAG: hypothetical protein C0485_17515 [Pirellula sp.]|nr:hypothetical protein [Pirellula sp.]
MDAHRPTLSLLSQAGRLLLRYNESSIAIHKVIGRTAHALTDDACHIVVSYSAIAISCGDGSPVVLQAGEITYNNAALIRVHQLLEEVQSKRLTPLHAIEKLQRIEVNTPRHSLRVVAPALAAGAASLAALLGADVGSAAIAAAATGIGLVARQILHRRCRILALPFAAAFLAGVMGGLGIQCEMTNHHSLALIVPCLMLVPGPHLINALLDLVDNYIPMAIARFALASGILLASGLGLLVGIELTLTALPEAQQGVGTEPPNLIADIALAAIVTGAFAIYYNTPWRYTSLAIVGGAVGHGIRSVFLSWGWSLETSTFLGAFSVGIISAAISRSSRTPVAVIAFAGAVTMMPGLQMYAALRGALQFARLQVVADSPVITATMANGAQSMIVVAALGLGLVLAARISQYRLRQCGSQTT